MSTRLIGFPFRLNADGSLITHLDDSDDYYAGELAMMVLTRPGERELVPDYGIEDAAFGDFDEVELASQVATFGPPVSIKNIEQQYRHPAQNLVRIDFDTVPRFEGAENMEGNE